MLTETILMVATIAAALVLLYPFRRGAKSADGRHRVELAVYRNQLKELERDRLIGLFNDEQADYVRAEIARRLFAANDNSHLRSHRPASHPRTLASMFVFLGAAFLLYLSIGRPDLPARPFERRASAQGRDVTAVIANIEQAATQHPDDGDASDMPEGPSPARLDRLAETLMAIAGGVVTEDARKILEQSLSLEPNNPRARFYIALGKEQGGKLEEARAAFEALAKQSPTGAPWLSLVYEHITRNGGTVVAPATQPTLPGAPTARDMAAAETMSSGDRQQMIRAMVESLNAKLGENPNDFEGWMRIVRSYAVLNDKARAADALKRGLVAFPASSEQGGQLLALAKKLEISTEGLTE
ncbi:c-type cytochrome biogenesis protein CcmI [Rhizobium ruizarguesonis]|uniref:C-type cytochrome biogenesis protein CcmI n=1 Tax=Rhizobium ruizarguesonis TaxID=2081791 RepID=A0AB38HS76_9HYPH|nr:c-type cytochrome biogenesis protein CcmI [Rhizobium ruizarguesonis]